MTVQAYLIFNSTVTVQVEALNNGDTAIIPRIINNPLANQLGYGPLQTDGDGVAGARILNDPEYERFWAICSTLPIQVMDSETLFLPESLDRPAP
ncbi:MAG: hypothetical protein P4L82_12180 [Ancalomicrobiaceae bacterium]|nr:hypothetical protein [Ancalomicrobiaceae bacterium]